MITKYKDAIYKFLSALAIAMSLFVPFLTARMYFFNTTALAGGALFSLLSFLLGFFLFRSICKNRYTLLKKVLVYVLFLVPALLISLIYIHESNYRIFFEIVFLFTFYALGIKACERSYSLILHSFNIYLGVFLISASIISSNLIDKLYFLTTPYFVVAFIYILIILLIKSEENIDYVLESRGIEMPEVQKKIRSSNIKIILLLFAGILLLFNFKSIIIVILRLVKSIAVNIIIAIFYLLSLFSGSKPIEQSTPEATLQPSLPEAASKSIVPYIFNAIILCIFIYLAIKLIPILFNKIIELYRLIKEKLFKVYNNKNYSFKTDECLEIIEFTNKLDEKKSKKRDKKLLKALKKATNPTDKVRLMYKIILSLMPTKGILIEPSETTGEISRKLNVLDNSNAQIKNLTNEYEKVRYNEKIPDENTLADIEKNYNYLVSKLSQKRR